MVNEQAFINSFKPVNLDIHGVRLPNFSIEGSTDNRKFLKDLCVKGLTTFNLKDKTVYLDRLIYELDIIEELGFTDYILLVWDVINFCHKNNIPVGMGRGSAAGSLTLYLIGVTQIDPIEYGLYFERFISKARAKKKIVDGVTYLDGSLMCDVDLDICYKNRHRVVEYLNKKFEGRTCKISTLNSLQGKLLIKECGKIIADMSEEQVKAVADMIPQIFGKVEDIEKVYEKDPNFKKWADQNSKIYHTALKLRGLIKNKSVHASAMLLSYYPLEKSVPTEINRAKKELVSCYDMNWASILNVKLDLLGLRAVTVIDDVCTQVGVKLSDIDFNDPFIYQNLYSLKAPHGLFQIEADTVFSACKKIKPKNLEELSGVMAVARPGAMQFIDQYSTYTNTGVSDSIHPFFDDILKSTGGLALYQEQLMQMVYKIGFTLDEAETVRRIVGKKKIEEAKEWKSKIENKIKEKGLDPEISSILWKILEDSANYSFNKSHSIAYAALAAATAYLKFKYPRQFFLSLLKMTRNEPDPTEEISKIQIELDYFGIKLLGPDLCSSSLDFSLEGENIRFGLLSVKGISDKSIERILKFKKEYFTKFDIFKAAEEAEISNGILCALIQCGAIPNFGVSRQKIVLEAQLWNKLTDKEKLLVFDLGQKFNYDLIAIIKFLETKLNEKGKRVIRESRVQTIKKHFEVFKDFYLKNKAYGEFAAWYYEKKLLGYSPSYILRNVFHNNQNFKSIREIGEMDENDIVEFVGYVKEAMQGRSKSAKKTKYYKMTIGDETGNINVMIFENNDKIEKCKKDNGDKLPKEENIVIVRGVKKSQSIFADKVIIQCSKIHTKLVDIKNEEDAVANAVPPTVI